MTVAHGAPAGRPEPSGAPSHRAIARAALGAALVLAAACAAPTRATAPPAADQPSGVPDSGVSLAGNAGPTLIVLSLDPGEPGENAVRVDLRDPAGAVVAGAVRVDLSLDGVASSATLAAGDRRGTLTVARAGRAELRATVLDGPSARSAVAFGLDLPAARVPDGTLAAIDRAMQGLHTLKEAQTLSGGGPVLLFRFESEAPDRVRYTTIGSTGLVHETRLIGRDRYDREGAGAWTRSDLGFPSKVPFSAYARGATRVRLIGRDQGLVELAFVQPPSTYYRVWAGTEDHLVRRYTMMAKGHYMTGVYTDFDAPIAISAP